MYLTGEIMRVGRRLAVADEMLYPENYIEYHDGGTVGFVYPKEEET